MLPRRISSLAAGLLVAFLAACSTGGSMGGGVGDSATASGQAPQFTGVALPQGYSLDVDRSLALGAGERWIGRIVFNTGLSTNDAFDFYRREMPNLGWNEGAVVRSETSMLTFTSPGTSRVAVVQISARTLSGSRVEMIVSPTSEGSDSTAAAAAAPMPMARPAPRTGVTSQPLQ